MPRGTIEVCIGILILLAAFTDSRPTLMTGVAALIFLAAYHYINHPHGHHEAPKPHRQGNHEMKEALEDNPFKNYL